MVMDWIALLQVLGSMMGGLGIGWLTKAGRLKDKAEAQMAIANAEKAKNDGYEARLQAMHTVVDNLNKTEIEHAKRIGDLNRTITDKVEQIRKYSDRLYESEKETNRVNDLLTVEQTKNADMERRIGELLLDLSHYKNWRCYRHDCEDKRGRKPKQENVYDKDGQDPE